MLSLITAKSLTKSAILVALFLQENGPQPVGVIAEVCGISERSVYAALKELKKISHDHDLHGSFNKGTAQVSALVEQEVAAAVQDTADPLLAELVELGIFSQAAARLLEKSGREAIAQQIAYHRYRIANGYQFRKAPAAMLYRACENPAAFPPPEGYHSTAYKSREGLQEEAKVEISLPRVERPKDEPLGDEAKRDTIRRMLQSPMLASKRLGLKLAAQWGFDAEAI